MNSRSMPRLIILILCATVTVLMVSAQSADELKAAHLLTDVNLLINTIGAQSQGEKHARVIVVEFFDYGCPYCGLYADQTLPQVLDEYVKIGKVRYIFRNFPNERSHSLAWNAAVMGECANEQGKYWEAHLRLLKDQQTLDTAALGLDPGKFRDCMVSGRASENVKRDVEEGRELKLPGTPSFYVGYPDTEDQSKVRAIKLLVGSQTFHVFKQLIDSLLNPPRENGETKKGADGR